MTDVADAPVRDYSATLFLPRTDFPMKAGLPQKEPEILKRWDGMGLYRALREASQGRETFLLHDGPPYANGNIHIGTGLNKILKDVVVRSHQMLGYDATYVPGWDCHGLPIEWKIEEEYRARGKSKEGVPLNEFRRECREFAARWIDVQREEFKRLGVVGDWENPYMTMSFAAEAQIARELMKFAASGGLYRGSKPVMWSVVEKTALAEAEVEYHEHVSTTIFTKFPVRDGAGLQTLQGASVVIWTTTPWTIPANRAIEFSRDIAYGLYEVTGAADGNWARPGDRYLLADDLAGEVFAAARVESYERRVDVSPEGLVCSHPFAGMAGTGGYYDFPVPLLSADFVTADQGTGFVHMAPGHGPDDYSVWVANRLGPVPHTVSEDGSYYPHVPLFAGRRVFTDKGKEGDANKAVVEALKQAGALVASGKLRHQYPHSWRSKAPLLFRNTPQWFIGMEDDRGAEGLRGKALKAIDETRFVPPSGRNRLRGMVEGRPDWVISRQRAWGVPITVFVHKDTGEVLKDDAVNARIAQAFEAEGADAWFAEGAKARFLGNGHDPASFDKVDDILDVWFESGTTHAFVLEGRGMKWPADLYLEGSDQHRGWFQSSLLESCGTRGRAPYDAVLTHGFVMDEQGRKMSKSLGNVVAPQDVIAKSGADILRLWVVSSDFTEDLRIGPEIIKTNVESYRKLRNTLRFLLGNLEHFTPALRVEPADMPELERYMLHRIAETDVLVRQSYREFDTKRVTSAVTQLMTVDLSAFYFDIRKDALYCDPFSSLRRQAALTVLDTLYSCLTAWLAPLMPFTMEEAWGARAGSEESVHLRLFPEIPADWREEALGERWRRIREVRRAVTGALEIERAAKRIGSSLEAAPEVYVSDPDLLAGIEGVDLAEVAITSGARLVAGDGPADAFRLEDLAAVAVVPARAAGRKCARSWKVLPEVGTDPDYPDVTLRDAAALREHDTRAQAAQ